MSAGRNPVVVPAILKNVGDGSAIDFQVGRNIPAEIRRSDDKETATRLSGGVANRKCSKERNSEKKSAELAG